MEGPALIVFLALATLIAVAVLAFISKRRTEQRMQDEDAEKSTLAADAPDHR